MEEPTKEAKIGFSFQMQANSGVTSYLSHALHSTLEDHIAAIIGDANVRAHSHGRACWRWS